MAGNEWLGPDLNALSGAVLDAAIEVHRTFGSGLYERVYERALALELRSRGLCVESQVPVPVDYRGEALGIGYRADLVVEGQVLVELKAVEWLTKPHFAQVLTYLKLSNLPLGLLVNFNAVPLHTGFRRVVRPDV